jgi:hypothetical protein
MSLVRAIAVGLAAAILVLACGAGHAYLLASWGLGLFALPVFGCASLASVLTMVFVAKWQLVRNS